MNVLRQAGIKPHGSVFIAMPFTLRHSADLARFIQNVCAVNQFEGRLADDPINPTADLRTDIFEHLRQAELVVVDLATDNANVRYELGIARALGKRLALLHPSTEPVSLELATLPEFGYGDLAAQDSRIALQTFITAILHKILSEIQPTVLDSVEQRTKCIIEDLTALLNLPERQLRRQTVWWSGSLSSFALGPDRAFEDSEISSRENLLREREVLINLARKGCRVVSMISPRQALGNEPESQIALSRLLNLLAFIESSDPALRHIDWLVAGWELKNCCIIGDLCCYERFQKAEDRGQALTLRQASAAAVRANTSVYELLFQELAYMTLGGKPPRDLPDRREMFRLATAHQLRDLIQGFRAASSNPS